MSDELEVLKLVATRLDAAGIAYMVSGSMAMNYYAQPRMTRDIDIVVELVPADTDHVVELFAADFYCDADAVRDAIAHRAMFNVIHFDLAVKVDFIVRKATPYREAEFVRRRDATVAGVRLWLVSAEDLLLSKLAWAKDSHSELQLKDARNLIASVPTIDWPYQGYGKVVDGGWRPRLHQAAPRYTAQKDGPLLGANGLVVLVKPKNPFEPSSRLLLAAYRGSVRDFAGTLLALPRTLGFRAECRYAARRGPHMTDTPHAVTQMYRALLMRRSGAERLEMGCGMFDTARAVMRASLGDPTGCDQSRQMMAQLFLRTYGADFDPATRDRIAAWLRADGRRLMRGEEMKDKG